MKKMKFLWLLPLLAGPVLAQQTDLLEDANTDPSVILLKHGRASSPELRDAFHQQQGGKVTPFKHVPWVAIQLPDGALGKQARVNYTKSKLFDRVAPQRFYRAGVIPNDEYFQRLWGMVKIQAPQAWDISTATDVIVAVIDTGIDYDHPDLQPNLWTGPNGEHGYTAAGGQIDIGGQDDHFHGTHVAGIIGAAGNNGIGVAGINWRVKFISFKFIAAAGFGSSIDAALCIDKMIELKKNGVDIRVSNNSWGALGVVDDPLLEDAFNAAGEAGILNVCAAGNDSVNTDETGFSPASLPVNSIVSVMASNPGDRKADFSNYGVSSADLLAPGVAILAPKLGGGYRFLSGTSMASPHVAGACAAMLGINPLLTPKQCKDVLLDPASLDRTGFLVNSTGGGRLNLYKCLTNPKLFAPPDNHDPILSILPKSMVVIGPGGHGSLGAEASDPDGDALIETVSVFGKHAQGWLIQRMTSPLLYPSLQSSPLITITNVPSGRDFAPLVRFNVSDGHGGGVSSVATLFTLRDESLVRELPTPTISITEGDPYPQLMLSMSGEALGAQYSYFASGRSTFGQTCCWPVNTENPVYADLTDTPVIFRAQAMDTNGNFVNSAQLVYDPLGNADYVPEIKMSINTTRGPSPLEVVADMSATDPEDQHHLDYTAIYWREGGVSLNTKDPVRRFTLTRPGLHPIEFSATDRTTRLTDVYVVLFTVLPAGFTVTNPPQPTPEPPQPSPLPHRLIAPQDLRASFSGSVLHLDWTDTSVGEDRWDLEYRIKYRGPWTAFSPLASLAADSTSFEFPAQDNAQYEFRVKACNGNLCSPYSNTASLRVR